MLSCWVILLVLVALSHGASSMNDGDADCMKKTAVCKIENGTITGVIHLSTPQSSGGSISVMGDISGLTPGMHGFHVHEFGDLSNGCMGAGGHYNPLVMNHGAPSDTPRHAGDLGNIDVMSDGIAHVDVTNSQQKLCGPYSIMGRAIVVHLKQDDLGKGGTPESLKNGNSGARVGCCIIGAASG